EIVINGAQFPNLESIGFFKTFHSKLTLLFNNPKFKHFSIALNPNLTTINGVLPPSTESAYIGDVPITSSCARWSEAVNIKGLAFASYAGSIDINIVSANTTLIGDLDISHIVELREFIMHGESSLDEILLPSKSDWTWFHLSSCPGIIISNTTLNEILASPNLIAFVFFNNNKSWSRNFTASDISDDCTGFYIDRNQITGTFIIDSPKPNLRALVLGDTVTEQNVFDEINLIGLDGSDIEQLYISGVQCEDLELPDSLPKILAFRAFDNKLDVTINTNLIDQINAMVTATEVRLGTG